MNFIHSSWMLVTKQIKYTSLSTLPPKNDGQFRNTVWDPFLIVSQIIALQCFYYFTLGIWLSLICFITNSSGSLDYVFRYQEINKRDLSGKLTLAAFLLNAFSSAGSMWFLMQRTKLCLDFSSTTHFIHLLACWSYNNQFPLTFSWWSLNIICLSIMCICGEFFCMKTELKAIPLSITPKIDL